VAPSFALGLGHLDTRVALKRPASDAQHEHGQHDRIRSVAETLPRPVDFRAFSLWVAMLTQLNGERIVRLKAVVSAHGEPTPVAVQAVQHVVYPPLNLPPNPALAGRSHVVVLTCGMDDAELEEMRRSLRALAG
jgi:G3E family GTPase